MKQTWSSPTTNSEAARRAGGRRRINFRRQVEAIERQVWALNLMWYRRMTPAEIAKTLGVSRVTVWRYLRVLDKRPKLNVHRPHGLHFDSRRGWSAYGYWY